VEKYRIPFIADGEYFSHDQNINNILKQLISVVTLCDKICQWLAAGRWFSVGTPVSSTDKHDCHDTTEILLKVVLNTIHNGS
jgi:hypothetical protein